MNNTFDTVQNGAVSLNNLCWNLRRISETLPTDHSSKSLAMFCAKHGIGAIWHEDPEVQDAIVTKLVTVVYRALEAGEITLSSLDFDPRRKVLYMRDNLYKAMFRGVNLWEYDRHAALELPESASVTADSASLIVAKAEELLMDGDTFQYLVGVKFVELIQLAMYDEADSLRTEFAPEKGLSRSFVVDLIPPASLQEAYQLSVDSVMSGLDRPAGLRYAERLVQMGLLTADELTNKQRELVKTYLGDDRPLPAHLEAFRALVPAEYVEERRAERVRQALARLRAGAAEANVASDLQILRSASCPESDIESALLDGYLAVLSAVGTGEKASAYAAALPAEKVNTGAVQDAAKKFASGLAASPAPTDAWLAAVQSHGTSFVGDALEQAVLAAAYNAKWGLGNNPAFVEKLMTAFPDLAWSTLDSLRPRCMFAGIDLRAVVTPQITDPVEATLAKVLFDWLGVGSDHPEGIQRYLEMLRTACHAVTRKVLSGRPEPELLRSQRVAAELPDLAEVPYIQILRLYRRVANALRSVGRDITVR